MNSCKTYLIDVDFVEAVVPEEVVKAVERFLADDDGVVGLDVDAPRPVNSLLLHDMYPVRHLDQKKQII